MATATQKFETLYLNAVKSICILEEQLEILTELNKTTTELSENQTKEIKKLEKQVAKLTDRWKNRT